MIQSASLVVVAFGDPALVTNLLASLVNHPDLARLDEIIIVENGIPAGAPSRLSLPPTCSKIPVTVLSNPCRSYSSGVNCGVAAATSPIVLVSNNDVLWNVGESIIPLLDALQFFPEVAIAAPQQLYPDGRWQRSHGPFPSVAQGLRALCMWEIVANRYASRRQSIKRSDLQFVDYVDGAFFAVKRAAFDAIGGFDKSYPFYGEDVEFSWQAHERGLSRILVPAARIRHIRGATSAPRQNADYLTRLVQSKIYFVARHHGRQCATLYRWLTRLHAWQLAALSEVSVFLWPSLHGMRRRSLTRLAVKAVAALPGDVLSIEP